MVYRKVVKELKKNGWYEVRCKGSHHQFAHRCYAYVVTVPDHGCKDLSYAVLNNLKAGTGLSF